MAVTDGPLEGDPRGQKLLWGGVARRDRRERRRGVCRDQSPELWNTEKTLHGDFIITPEFS